MSDIPRWRQKKQAKSVSQCEVSELWHSISAIPFVGWQEPTVQKGGYRKKGAASARTHENEPRLLSQALLGLHAMVMQWPCIADHRKKPVFVAVTMWWIKSMRVFRKLGWGFEVLNRRQTFSDKLSYDTQLGLLLLIGCEMLGVSRKPWENRSLRHSFVHFYAYFHPTIAAYQNRIFTTDWGCLEMLFRFA